jgi:hypothetical protein
VLIDQNIKYNVNIHTRKSIPLMLIEDTIVTAPLRTVQEQYSFTSKQGKNRHLYDYVYSGRNKQLYGPKHSLLVKECTYFLHVSKMMTEVSNRSAIVMDTA